MNLPLAEKFRPHTFDDVFGQDHLVGEESLLRKSVSKKRPLSILLFGPPGCGKTTIATLYVKVKKKSPAIDEINSPVYRKIFYLSLSS